MSKLSPNAKPPACSQTGGGPSNPQMQAPAPHAVDLPKLLIELMQVVKIELRLLTERACRSHKFPIHYVHEP